jgi:hypothetical protein
MFARIPSAPVVPAAQRPDTFEPLHLMLVKTPSFTPRGRKWLERTRTGVFDGRELQRLIRLEKLSLG